MSVGRRLGRDAHPGEGSLNTIACQAARRPGANLTRSAIVLTGALIALLLAVAPARAEGEAVTEVAIRPLDPVVIGSAVTVIVDLRLESGAPVANSPITLTIPDQPVRVSQTDTAGAAAFRLTQDLPPGEYPLVATYAGATGAYLGANDELVLSVLPFELAVETVPALPGMVFTLDGKRFTAGADGIARRSVAAVGDHQLGVLDDAYRGDGQRAEFSGWSTGLQGRQVVIHIPLARPLEAGFDIHLQASQSFVDGDGGPVDPARVTSITLRSSFGDVATYPDGRQRLLKASRALRGPHGLESEAVRYEVEAVEVDGSNVVEAGQRNFGFGGDEPWEIKLMLFSAHLQPRDALFGFTAGRSVDVYYPDGEIVRIDTDVDGQLAVPLLARGIYRMTVADAPGWAPVAPVAVSPGHEVVLRVVSYLDMLVAALVATGLALWLARIGHRYRLPTALRRTGRRPAAVAHQQARRAPRIPLVPGTVLAAEGSSGNYLAAIPIDVPAAASEFPRVRVRLSIAARSGAPAAMGGVVRPALRRRGHVGALGAPSVAGSGRTERSGAAELTATAQWERHAARAATATRKARPTRRAKTTTAADASLGRDQAKSVPPKARRRGVAPAAAPPRPELVASADAAGTTGETARSKTKVLTGVARPSTTTKTVTKAPTKATREAGAKRNAKAKPSAKAMAAPSGGTTNPAAPIKRDESAGPRRSKPEPGRKSTPASSPRSTPANGTGIEPAAVRHDLRLAQLQALGIDDPGEGPMALRERWTFVPETSAESISIHDIESCAQCGSPVWPDAPFCRRCGYRQSESSVVPRVRAATEPAPQGNTVRAGRSAPPGTRAYRLPPKAR